MAPENRFWATAPSLNESPSEKEGKSEFSRVAFLHSHPPLNESPSEKEGKLVVAPSVIDASLLPQ